MHRQPPSPARSMNQNQADLGIPRRFNRRGKCSSYRGAEFEYRSFRYRCRSRSSHGALKIEHSRLNRHHTSVVESGCGVRGRSAARLDPRPRVIHGCVRASIIWALIARRNVEISGRLIVERGPLINRESPRVSVHRPRSCRRSIPSSRTAALYDRKSSVTNRSGTKAYFFRSLRISFNAACLLRVDWTSTSRTSPSASTARQR